MINNDGVNRLHLRFCSNNDGAKTYSTLLHRKRRCDSLACYCGCQSRVQGVWGVRLWHIFAYTVALNSLCTAPNWKIILTNTFRLRCDECLRLWISRHAEADADVDDDWPVGVAHRCAAVVGDVAAPTTATQQTGGTRRGSCGVGHTS